MSKKQKRRIEFDEWVKKPGESKPVKTTGVGIFHLFGINYKEFETGPGIYTTAVIETENGSLKNIPVEHCRFIEMVKLKVGEKPYPFSGGFEAPLLKNVSLENRINNALSVIRQYGSVEGAHHKTWVIDQVVRALTGSEYKAFVAAVKAGFHGPNTHEWDVGIAP